MTVELLKGNLAYEGTYSPIYKYFATLYLYASATLSLCPSSEIHFRL